MKILLLGTMFFLSTFSTLQTQPKPKATSALTTDGIDPICKMTVKKGETRTSTYKGQTIGFCSDYCKKKFDENPAKYTKK